MSEWVTKNLDECVDILDHLRIPVNEEERSLQPGNTPYYGANGVQGLITGWIFNEPLILVAEDGGHFEEFETRPIAYKISGKSWVNNHAHVLKPKEGYDFDFLFHSLEHKNVLPFIKGGTRAKLNQGELRGIKVLFPKTLQIQHRLANILLIIDQTIEKTEAQIRKYQQIKTGLMHDLFTRGLTADGKRRPPREQTPELYQETSIGWLPKEWEYDELVNFLAPISNSMRSGPFGSALLKSELVGEGIPFLGIDNIHVEEFIPIFRRFVSSRKFNELNKYAVKVRDVVITIMGTVGRCAVVPVSIGQALSSKHLWTMTFDQKKVVPELICWQLNYADWVKAWFRKETQGGIMDAIQSNTLKTLILPIPPQNEQKKIFERYRIISSTIQNEKDHLEKLKKQKSGLMHDLLTGKVQVKIDQEESANGE